MNYLPVTGICVACLVKCARFHIPLLRTIQNIEKQEEIALNTTSVYCNKNYQSKQTEKIGRSDVWLTVHLNSVWIRKTN